MPFAFLWSSHIFVTPAGRLVRYKRYLAFGPAVFVEIYFVLMESPAPALHVVFVSFPLQGHVNPLLLIARLLANRKGFHCTMVVTQQMFNRVMKEKATSSSTTGNVDGVQFVAISEEPSPASSIHSASTANSDNTSTFDLKASLDVMMRMRAGFENFIKGLVSPPCCLITDMFVTWAHDSARKLGLHRFPFFTTNASTFCSMFHLPSLISQGLFPLTDASYEDPHYFIDCIPGIPPLRPRDFSEAMRFNNQFVLQLIYNVEKDEGVIFNTTYELEREPLDALREKISIFPIGPLLLLCDDINSSTINFWPEETDCISWLDAQAPSSVLYVAFGSLAAMPSEQMIELAEGLEASQQPFLWVIRPNAVKGSQSFVLPEGFADRTKERGLIISWAPQLQVLAHSSLGGFLTHCGWNSTTENLSKGGVPMICWPQGAEQRLNCRLIVDLWKIGIEFCKEMNGVLVKSDVERAVRALMQGEEGRAMKTRARQLKETVSRAVEGGSSHKYFEAFVESVKMKAKQG